MFIWMKITVIILTYHFGFSYFDSEFL